MGKSSAEIDRGPPQGAAEVSAKLPPAALESTLHVSCMYKAFIFCRSACYIKAELKRGTPYTKLQTRQKIVTSK